MDAARNLFGEIFSNSFAIASTKQKSSKPFRMPVSSARIVVVSGLIAPGKAVLHKIEGATNCHLNVRCLIAEISFTKVSAQGRPISTSLKRNQQTVKLLLQARQLFKQLLCS